MFITSIRLLATYDRTSAFRSRRISVRLTVRVIRAIYISRRGALEIETDEGEFIGYPHQQKQLLDEWHLDLTAGQYRRQKEGERARRPTKLVRNIATP